MSKRAKFFIGHLSISLSCLLILFFLIYFIWFFPPLIKATGILSVFIMLVVIDLIVGPLLTFLVYKEGKSSLKFDLSFVIILQVCSFLYGSYIIFEARPVWIVYNLGKYDLVQSFEVVEDNINNALPEFQRKSNFYPKYAAVKPLPNSERIKELQFGMSTVQKPERFFNILSARLSIVENSLSLNTLKKYNSHFLVDSILTKYPQATGYVPLKANAVDMTVLINKEKGEVIKIVDLRPWK
ncbi:type IV pilin accessory protein [bacterium SPL81]|nr:type IV pilin accessory protein [Acinetobacter baumannii]